MNDCLSNPLKEFRKVNVDLSVDLVKKALKYGVRRFIYISTIKVNGELTNKNAPFTPEISSTRHDLLCKLSVQSQFNKDVDPYTLSKFEAEKKLKEACRKTSLELVIIRPPLVYGKGVKGNFETMMKIIHKSNIIPLGDIRNQRSLVYVGNLVSLIDKCIVHPNAANQTFLVSDGNDISTSKLILYLSKIINKNSKLYKIHSLILKVLLYLFKKNNIYSRLCESLQVDITNTIETLDWSPPFDTEKSLYRTAEFWLNDNHSKFNKK